MSDVKAALVALDSEAPRQGVGGVPDLPLAGVDDSGALVAHAPSEEPEPILTRWLQGESIVDLAGKSVRDPEFGADLAGFADLEAVEKRLRRELAELQKHLGIPTAQRNAYNESARKLNALLGSWAAQAEAASDVFGEWHPDPFWHGYGVGRGAAARQFQRTLEFLGNVIRVRATHDGKTGEE